MLGNRSNLGQANFSSFLSAEQIEGLKQRAAVSLGSDVAEEDITMIKVPLKKLFRPMDGI